jgi:hypothetical protein
MMSDSSAPARERLLEWMLDLLDRSPEGWDPSQRAFINSLMEGQEGTKTLAQLAVATAHLRASGLDPKEMGSLRPILEAMESFWSDPSSETFEFLHLAGKSLNTDS